MYIPVKIVRAHVLPSLRGKKRQLTAIGKTHALDLPLTPAEARALGLNDYGKPYIRVLLQSDGASEPIDSATDPTFDVELREARAKG